MVKVNLSLRISPYTRVPSIRTRSTERVPTNGQTAEPTKGTGKTGQWMAKECSNGKIGRNMSVLMLTIIRRDLESLPGQMEGSIVVSGKKESSMEEGHLQILTGL